MSKKKAQRSSKTAKDNRFHSWIKAVPSVPGGGPITVNVPIPMHNWQWFHLANAAAVNGKTIGEVIDHALYHGCPGLAEWGTGGFKM
jgi:hypothetical protein